MSTTRKMLIVFSALAALGLALIAYNTLFLHKVSTDPKVLFYRALEQNLSEKAVTCIVTQSRSGTSEQLAVQLDLASKTNARSVLTVDTGDTTVQTEEIVVKSSDYLRYTKVGTKATDADGKQPDLSKIVNKWIKTDGKQKPRLFGQTALGGCVVPFASISTGRLVSLNQRLESGKVFATDFRKTKSNKLGIQPVRQYAVDMAPQSYIAYMQAVGRAYGLNNLQDIDLRDFSGKAARKAVFSINTDTGRLAEIHFSDENRVVSFKDYGKVPELSAPAKTITNAEAGRLAQ